MRKQMVRFLGSFIYVLVLAVFLVAGTGVANYIEEGACHESCPGDDDRGNCPPDCAACVCCAHTPSITPPAALDIAPTLSVTLGPLQPALVLPSSDPRDIEHVPKFSRA